MFKKKDMWMMSSERELTDDSVEQDSFSVNRDGG